MALAFEEGWPGDRVTLRDPNGEGARREISFGPAFRSAAGGFVPDGERIGLLRGLIRDRTLGYETSR